MTEQNKPWSKQVDEAGYAQSIEFMGIPMLDLATGSQRNEMNVDTLIEKLNHLGNSKKSLWEMDFRIDSCKEK